MKRHLAFFILLIFCFSWRGGAATYTYDYSENCRKAYENYLSLHVGEARGNLINEISTHPYNLMATYIADYEDCILLLLNCDKNDYTRREDHLEERIELLEKGDEASPWYRFCKAGVYLHWAIVNVRFGEQYSAAMNFRRSFALLKENQRRFPQFEYNQPFAGLEEAVVGSLPGSYKWLAALFGMKGSVKGGTEKLAKFVSSHKAGDLMYSETVLYYLYTRFYLLTQQKEVWEYLASPQFSTRNNLLHTFVKANLAIDARHSDAAIETLTAAAREPDYSQYPIFDYQMAMALFNKTDTSCNIYFRQYLAKNKSDLYIKDSWQKMALARYVEGNMAMAEFCRQQIKLHGTTRIDADKQAQKFAESNRWPLKQLLQARLLIEGGYYNRASGILGSIDTNMLLNPADKAEYFFRNGRIYEELAQYNNALEQYQHSINVGKDRHEQFAARAALHMGKVYEHTGNTTKALNSYRQCLDMPAHDFQNSIDQQAKAGVNRVEEK